MDVLKFSHKTKREAGDLLKYGNVLEVLANYGKVVVTGSYAYNLMWGPDIDLVVVCDKPQEASYRALKDFIRQRRFQKYQLGDFIKFPLTTKSRPHGVIVVLVHEYKSRRWEIEIWFQKSLAKNDTYFNTLLLKASSEQRKAILELKYQREKRGLAKHGLDSTTLYTGVLTKGKVNIDDYQKESGL